MTTPTPIRRHADWQPRLAAFIESRLAAHFVWGANDCCLFAADAVAAMTGRDLARHLRGYATERAAQRLVRQLGGMAAIATAALGEPIAPPLARVGDIVLGELGAMGAECLGVCTGATWHAPGADSLCAAPMAAARLAWRV